MAQQIHQIHCCQHPYKKDILGEMVKAFNDEGIDVHFYFSVMDWSHPDYRYDIKSKEDDESFRPLP